MWKFKPILKQTIWGGNKIAAFKGEPLSADSNLRIGESYEISGLPGHETVVDGGAQDGLLLSSLIQEQGVKLLGSKNVERTGMQFPLLVKFLDVSDDLSVQVHPDDEMASRRGMSNGKSELWYVLKATPEARLCAGFTKPISAQDYEQALQDGTITKYLSYTSVKPGDVYYIPAGTVHSLCRGCLVLEIQQPSETTYRIFDYNRKDSDGILRELHTADALEALDLNRCGDARIPYPDERETASGLLSTRHFTVNRISISYKHTRDYKDIDSFKILVVISGKVDISDSSNTVTATQGTLLLVAAEQNTVTFLPHGQAEIIEVYV